MVTTLFPFGGGSGSGAFDFRLASIGTILDEFDDAIGWGIINNQYYIYNKDLVAAGVHLVDTTETFAHVSPIDHTSYDSRKEAADQLLRTACEWLLLHDEPQVTYVVDVFTIGEPRPGDVVSLNYAGDSPQTTFDISLIITEVSHRVETGGEYAGLRVTTLTLNKAGFKVLSGPRMMARELASMRQTLRQSNFGSRGDAYISYDRVEFGDKGEVNARTGDMTVRAQAGDVYVKSDAGDVNISGAQINVTGPVVVGNSVRADDGLVMPDEAGPGDWQTTTVTVRGRPHLKATYRARGS